MNLKDFLKDHDLTLQKFADLSQMSIGTVQRAIQEKPVTPQNAFKINYVTKGLVSVAVRNTGRPIGYKVKGKIPRTKHAMSHTTEFKIWSRMRRSCYSPRFVQYKTYGALGIFMCKEWENDFCAFLNDMGRIPEGYRSLMLKPDKLVFCKENCFWTKDARGSRKFVKEKLENSLKEKRKLFQSKFNEKMEVIEEEI